MVQVARTRVVTKEVIESRQSACRVFPETELAEFTIMLNGEPVEEVPIKPAVR